jgi:hypothetical protein
VSRPDNLDADTSWVGARNRPLPRTVAGPVRRWPDARIAAAAGQGGSFELRAHVERVRPEPSGHDDDRVGERLGDRTLSGFGLRLAHPALGVGGAMRWISRYLAVSVAGVPGSIQA